MLYTVKNLKKDLLRGIKHSYYAFVGGLLSFKYLKDIEIEGINYFCGYQYIEAQRALLFNDEVAYDAILNCTSIDEISKIKIKGVDDNIWYEKCQDIIRNYLRIRVSQDKMMQNSLKGLSEDVLVYCDKDDLVLGAGIFMFDCNIENPAYWEGNNIYGFLLTEIRDELLGKVGV